MDSSDSELFGTFSDEDIEVEDHDDSDGDSKDEEDCLEEKRIAELSRDDIMQMEFADEDAVYRFYKTYAMVHGFAVRLDEVRRDSDGRMVMRQIVCNREGSRREKVQRDERVRDHRPVTRSRCPAKIRASLDVKKSKWKVVSFYEGHSHDLVDPVNIKMMPEYRNFSAADKAQVKNLHDTGIRTCHIMGYLAAQKGGFMNLTFNKKDLYNLITQHRKEKVRGGDANAAISFLRGKVGNDNWMRNLFWADGISRIDYECFGDVLAFDSTYNRNVYNKPLVIFSGCNHHGQTVIFGCGLLMNEDIGSYKWLLETFLESMGNKHPSSVVTDGDHSMREAIKQVFPHASHRLCAWHLHRNACEKVKIHGFLNAFKNLIYANVGVEEFEVRWGDMIDKYKLAGNPWVDQTHEMRQFWALAYLRNQFFGRIRTTSQCEGINSLINAYVRKKNNLLEFINNMESSLRHYRHNERVQEFKSKYTKPMLITALPKLESFSGNIFTRIIHREVRKEIEGACAMNVEYVRQAEEKLFFKCNSFGDPDVEHVVEFDRGEGMFRCECMWFEHRGIPCKHIFGCLRHEHIEIIPDRLICKRWTKNAKSDFVQSGIDDPNEPQRSIKFRLGVLSAECSRMMDIACKNSGSFAEAMNDVASTISKLQLHADENFTKNSEEDFIRDPLVVKSKGAPKTRNTKFKQIRRCSNCGVIGHYNRSCPNYDGPSQDGSLAADGRVKSSNPSSATFTEQRRKRKVSNVRYEDSDESWEKVVDTKGGKKKRS